MALWVFGYGSLIWDPGFVPAEKQLATLPGFHRSFCMHSLHYRGTPEAPGLVLALDRQPSGTCRGLAYRVAEGEEEAVLAALRARELISSAYLEEWHEVAFEAGGGAEAVAYVIDRAHEQYCGRLTLEAQAAIIARAEGGRGPNRDYLHRTVAHLAELGIRDPELDWLDARVRVLAG
jgi:glutathione-specific gamma-glutamylcyclotransferase